MSVSHKRRLARLLASMPPPGQAEKRAVERREGLRWNAKLCACIRRTMVRRGIDPEAAPALLKYEAEARREAELERICVALNREC